MENFKQSAKRSAMISSAVAAVLSGYLLTEQASGDEFATANKEEKNRRLNNTAEAKKQVVIGDAAYESGSYGDAVEAYQRAVGLLPDAPAVKIYKEAVNDRYSKAVIAYSGQLSREGRYAEGQKILGELMDHEIHGKNPDVVEADTKFNDPIRNNPSATPQHTANVDKVRRLLYKAQGAYELADYDLAKKLYDDVLLIDPYNQAARRGQQKVHAEISRFARASYDEARTRLLTDVDEAWEIKPRKDFVVADPIGGDGLTVQPIESETRQRLSEIIIPQFDVENASVISAINRFKVIAQENSIDKKELNIIVNLGDSTNQAGLKVADKRFNLSVSNIPALALLDLICKQSGTEWVANEFVISVLPDGQIVDRLIRRSFVVPPGFITSPLLGEESFSTDVGSSVATRADVSLEKFLDSIGVTLPTGSKSHYSKRSNLLTLVNTPANMLILERAIDAAKIAQNVVVKVDVKIFSVLQEDIEELGYDWLLGDQSLATDGSVFLGGGTTGTGTGINPGGGIGGVTAAGVTSGLRSGELALPGTDSLGALLLQETPIGQLDTAITRSPGILEGTAFVNDSVIQGILRGLEQKNSLDSLDFPSVTTRSGERARFVSTRLFPYPEDFDPPQIPNNIGGATFAGGGGGATIVPITPPTPTAFTERETGIILDVEPTVALDRGSISLEINTQFAELLGFVNYGSPILALSPDLTGTTVFEAVANDYLVPVFQETTLETGVVINNGATVAVGGLQTVQISQVSDKVPLISDLPFVGRFFETNATETIRNSVLIFASAQLLDLTGKPWTK